jgi:hypothetical protein
MRQLARDQRDNHQLAVLGRAEGVLAIFEIFGEHLRRRRGNIACQGAVEQHVFDCTLLVLIAVCSLDKSLRGGRARDDGAGKLAAQQPSTLRGDVASLGKAGVADRLLETETIELTIRSRERGIGGDHLGDLGIGKIEAELVRCFIEHDFGDDLSDHHPIEPHGAGLIHADGVADLPRKLLQPLVVLGAELLDRNLGAADLSYRGAPEATKDVANAPDREADDQEADHRGHDHLAKPIGGGFS